MKIVKKLNYFLMAVVFFATVACSSGASTENTEVVEETVVEEVEAVVDTTATMAMDSVAVDSTVAE